MKIDFKKIANTAWYRQHSSARAYFALTPMMGVIKHLNVGQDIIAFQKADQLRGYYSETQLLRLAIKELAKIKRDKNRLPFFYKKWNAWNRHKLLPLIEKIRKTDLKSISNKELISLNKQLGYLSLKFWERPIFMDIFDTKAAELIKKQLKNAFL